MHIDLKSLLSLLLAAITIYTFIKAMRLDFLLEPVTVLWRGLSKKGKAFIPCVIVLFALFAVSKDGTNTLENSESGSTNTNSQNEYDFSDSNIVNRIMGLLGSRKSYSRTLPEWYIAIGYGTTDSDGDGIPDDWERWTRTNPQTNDADLDPDGDGVCNYDEFINQCDPMCSDTDGDGFSDSLEISGMATGKPWFNPLVRASYDYVEVDENNNGIPDRWENTGYSYGFTDADSNGLCDNIAFVQKNDDNFDVIVTVTTTRSALLTWGTNSGEGYVVQPCTNLSMRLRLTCDGTVNVKLYGALPNDGSDGLWYAKMEFSWPSSDSQETEYNRVRLGNGTMVDCENLSTEFRGEIDSTNMSVLSSSFISKWLELRGYVCPCWEHSDLGCGAEVICTNVSPPFTWYVNGEEMLGTHGNFITIPAILEYWDEYHDVYIYCEKSDAYHYNLLPLSASCAIDIGHCESGITNIVGAAWTSTHSHTNATDHLPRSKVVTEFRYSEDCPLTRNVEYCVGWDHAKVNTRNLCRLSDGEDIDHCLGIVGAKNDEIDFSSYISVDSQAVLESLKFTVNGKDVNGHIFTIDGEPSDLDPLIYEVNVLGMDNITLDKMWLVVSSQDSRDSYNAWLVNEADTSWTVILPKPFASLAIATNSTGDVMSDIVNGVMWNKPSKINSRSYMHHDAVYEMRSHPVDGGHGHQATYNGQGVLILSTIAAGTADKSSPESIWNGSIKRHRIYDVLPYIRCLQLDGNPILTDNATGLLTDAIPTRFTTPCIFQGPETDDYLVRRPTNPTGVTNE